MTGGMCGHYEPEWSEETIFGHVREAVYWNARPDGMTDKQWDRLVKITGATPITEDELREMMS
ncbi:hypothetical protein CWM47_17435 [Spirosoma pollinicola]|uniref:Uncharacterized protein n=1 Tax=Spirosoma pollinicola TaxID=2057025 RepID=A0A2K8Z0P9_9BACT|nr:hypothetical protein CWM47_17435 [Spirosoma pollinicola]